MSRYLSLSRGEVFRIICACELFAKTDVDLSLKMLRKQIDKSSPGVCDSHIFLSPFRIGSALSFPYY